MMQYALPLLNSCIVHKVLIMTTNVKYLNNNSDQLNYVFDNSKTTLSIEHSNNC